MVSRPTQVLMQIDIKPGDSAWEAAAPLLEAVWSPEIMARAAWRDVVWAHASRRVLLRDSERPGAVVCHIGIYLRHALWDGLPVRIGGIGGVATRADRRGQGFASAGMTAALNNFRADPPIDFGLLFCEPHNFEFYRQLGWHRFDGEVFVEQPAGRTLFEAMTPFVYDLAAAPRAGMIDLQGLPW